MQFQAPLLKELCKKDPKIIPKSMKILFRTPSCLSCCSHGLPRCSRTAEMVPRGAKMEAPSPSNSSREELKWAGGRGAWPLRVAALPRGEPGVIRKWHHSAESAAGPSKLDPKMFHFSCLNFSTLSFMQKLQNLRNGLEKGPRLEAQTCTNRNKR